MPLVFFGSGVVAGRYDTPTTPADLTPTLASRIDGQQMRVHVLDDRLPWQATTAELEAHLERLLGEREPR